MKIHVTKTFLPPKDLYLSYLDRIYESGIITNQGDLVYELEKKLTMYLNIMNFRYVTNGTVALQLSLRSLGIECGEIITTPFSYVATVSSILWEHCTPIFADIEPNNFTLDANNIEKLITEKTKAIMPVHVFGYACDVEKIQQVADKYNLKVIYDAAHTFGSFYNGKALCSFGDISTLSFHATKLFHTIEGGACIVKDIDVFKKLSLMMRFGHNINEHTCLGINAKQSEFNAAMGLANLSFIQEIIKKRKELFELYTSFLSGKLQLPCVQERIEYNYGYYPVVFESEKQLLMVMNYLAKFDIYPRRYFYPSLNLLPYIENEQSCPVSESISSRIICLPLYYDLSFEQCEMICKKIISVIS